MKSKSAQFTLPFLDTTSISGGGFDLYSSFGAPASTPTVSGDEDFDRDKSATSDERARSPAQNFRLDGDRKLAAGWKARAADNLASIRLAQAIEDENRNATPDEQDLLARFTAFGAGELANNLFRRAGDELSGRLGRTRQPARAAGFARGSRQPRPRHPIRAFHAGIRRPRHLGGLAAHGGRRRAVLEPGCGTGLFFALMPEALAGKTALTGIEMDATTARIAKLLYPNA